MAALSYKGRFVDYVEAGLNPRTRKRKKRKTIRNFRKHIIKEGDTLHHFYGMRTKFCRKLGTSKCTGVYNIIIKHRAVYVSLQQAGFPEYKGKYQKISSPEILNKFAYEDGFAGWEDMKRWWSLTHGPRCFPFVGQLIQW